MLAFSNDFDNTISIRHRAAAHDVELGGGVVAAVRRSDNAVIAVASGSLVFVTPGFLQSLQDGDVRLNH